ncbi:hypothetical protein EW145_g7284 [Phellinidium pouzarii]|uniref:Major facilitator superfamily (MFS) profile domain-containing protein n=1 Tax=Phellinidium pouzarii TaxID=167371 RepID=A0A4S4KM63_9AGAM|nr:hypothetical protein EW145_g7284 [Phellinidium pouzarii]
MIIYFLDVRVPRLSFKEKMRSLDWFGNVIIIASTTAVVIALTWGGIKFAWTSANVLVPLILGLFGLGGFVWYEFYVPTHPVLPFQVLSSRTSLSGYTQAFFGNFFQFATVYYLPLYYQACKNITPLMSGVNTLPLSLGIMPFAMASGISIAKTGRYRPQLWSSWAFLLLAAGLFSTLKVDSNKGAGAGFQIFMAVGLGVLQAAPFFPILAPIDISLNPNALAFFMFVRFFSQTLGISIGGTIIQNALQDKLPAEFISQLPTGTSIVYSVVEIIPTLDEPLQTNVRVAFGEALKTFWQVLIGIAALGLMSSLFMKGLPLHTSTDRASGLPNEEEKPGPFLEDMESALPNEQGKPTLFLKDIESSFTVQVDDPK